jgi:homoserine O-acetyltransferase
VARQIAMVSYRTHNSYFTKFGRRENEGQSDVRENTRAGDNFAVQSYLKHQGEKFIERGFDANTYLTLTRMMDTHDISRGRGQYLAVLNTITIPILIVGITSDARCSIFNRFLLSNRGCFEESQCCWS